MKTGGAAQEVIERARAEGRAYLTEPEGLAIVGALGIGVPRHVVVADAKAAGEVDRATFPGQRVVVKVVSPEILHKAAAGGVEVVAAERAAAAVERMEKRFEGRAAGFMISELVEHEVAPGSELLLGMRHTADFGPIVTCGPGGSGVEALAALLGSPAILSPALDATPEDVAERLAEHPAAALLRPTPAELAGLVARWLDFAAGALPAQILELEINPLVWTPAGPVALDAVVRVGDGEPPAPAAPRPLAKLARLLEPRTMAVIGVSAQMNPGRILLRNTLAQGFDRERLWVVKPGRDEIDGCRCVPDAASLPGKVDLAVLAVDAAQVPARVDELVAGNKAESLIVIPGGLGERSGSEGRADALRATLAAARSQPGGGPVLNGGNCLGVRSLPGRYDTLFIPRHKLRFPEGGADPLALVAQSGAFAVARASSLWALDPRFVITVGNQLDLTIGDYLEYLAEDPKLRVVACYVEGFRPGDGLRFVRAARAFVRRGGAVILYRAGRTAAGASASASHTASIAGDYAVSRELAAAAGVLVADSLADFDDLVRLAVLLADKPLRGRRLGALSNAGFECVAIADRLGEFQLPAFGEATRRRLETLFASRRVDRIVAVQNPLDLTPILDDEAFEQAARAVLEDDRVDAGVLGCVPLTGALATLAAGPGHGEDAEAEGSLARRLARLASQPKPWVAVVDGGPLYDPMVRLLEGRRVPVFRTADRALRLFGAYCRWRLAQPHPAASAAYP